MSTPKKSLLRRLLKAVVMLGLALVATGAVAWFALRDEIVAKVLDTVETRLAAKGLFLDRSSQRLSWTDGVVLTDLRLVADKEKNGPIVSLVRIAIRIPLRDLLRENPRVVVSTRRSGLQISTSAGDLRLEDLDVELDVSPEVLEIERFESRFKGVRLTLGGALRWKEGEGTGKVTIPDLSPVVKAISTWVDFPVGEPTLALQLTPRDTPEGGIDLSGELEGKNLQWKRIPMTSAKVQVALGDGTVELPSIVIECFGGRLIGGLSINYREGRLTITEVTSSVDPFPFVAALPLSEVVGRAMKPFRSYCLCLIRFSICANRCASYLVSSNRSLMTSARKFWT